MAWHYAHDAEQLGAASQVCCELRCCCMRARERVHALSLSNFGYCSFGYCRLYVERLRFALVVDSFPRFGAWFLQFQWWINWFTMVGQWTLCNVQLGDNIIPAIWRLWSLREAWRVSCCGVMREASDACVSLG